MNTKTALNCANIALTENIIKFDDLTVGSDTTAEHIAHLCFSIHPFGIWTCFHRFLGPIAFLLYGGGFYPQKIE